MRQDESGPLGLTSTPLVATKPLAGATFHEHMARARLRWSQGELPAFATARLATTARSSSAAASSNAFSASASHLTATRPASAATTMPAHPRPAPAVAPLSLPLAASFPAARVIGSPVHHYRSSRPPPDDLVVTTSLAPPRTTNLTHVPLHGGLAYTGEYFAPPPFMPRRFHRGWELGMPRRDDEEEERVWARNLSRDVKPPLLTLTAAAVKLKPKLLGRVSSSSSGGGGGGQPVGESRPVARLKKKMQPFFTLPETDDDDDTDTDRTAVSAYTTSPSPTGTTAAVADLSFVRRRHQLHVDKNAWSEIRLVRDGLEPVLSHNAATPAGMPTTRDHATYTGVEREFSSLSPDSTWIGDMYRTTHAGSFRPYSEDISRRNLLLARSTSRPSDMDARARTNTQVHKIYRPAPRDPNQKRRWGDRDDL